MKGTTKQGLGSVLLGTGAVTLVNSFKFHTIGPFWLGGTITIIGVVLAVLGWKLISRGRGDAALADKQRNDAEVAKHQAWLSDGHPHDQRRGDGSAHSSETESSLEDPPESQ